jgi:hypothetical protein
MLFWLTWLQALLMVADNHPVQSNPCLSQPQVVGGFAIEVCEAYHDLKRKIDSTFCS